MGFSIPSLRLSKERKMFMAALISISAMFAVASVVFAFEDRRTPYAGWELASVIAGLLSLVGVFTILWNAR